MGTAVPLKRSLAREYRREATEAERLLWQSLRRKSLGVRFRRQHPLRGFIVDFYAARVRLAVEVDGDIHDAASDKDRDLLLASLGVATLRFSNAEVLEGTGGVLCTILQTVESRGQAHQRSGRAIRPDGGSRPSRPS